MEIKISKKQPSMIDIMRQHYEENLRDEFAKAALTGLLATNQLNWGDSSAEAASYSYQLADALLRARKVNSNG